MLIDTHCHIFSDSYDNVDDIVLKALNNDVKILVVSGYNKETNEEAIALASKYDQVYATIGYGPSAVFDISDDDITLLEKQLFNPKVIAIGEIGLDYYWYKDKKDIQMNWFAKQIRLAIKHKKPVIIHSREAINDTYTILKRENINVVGGIMHCFSSSLEMANEFIKLNLLIGVGGVITFKNTKLGQVIKEVPIEYIVLETDSPYLTPEPFRGKINEPSNIKLIAEKAAQLKEMEYDLVAEKTSYNASRLFDLK